MKRIFKYCQSILLLSIVVSCGDSREDKLQLTIANKYINYVDTSQILTDGVSYKNVAAREKATNIITYTFSNPTNKKYLLVFDSEFPEPMYSNKNDRMRSFIGYSIFSGKGVFKRYDPGIICDLDSDTVSDSRIIFDDRIDKYKKLGITKHYSQEVYNYLYNSVTIYPGEKRTFKSVVMLPVVLERKRGGGGVMRYRNLADSDAFQLLYNCNAIHLKSELPQDMLDELEYNKIEIFDGQVFSNKLPLRKIE